MWGGQGQGGGGQGWGNGGGGWPSQAAVQAMPHGSVDWAALAQQWIAGNTASQMMGGGGWSPAPPVARPPPPPMPMQTMPRFPGGPGPRPPRPQDPLPRPPPPLMPEADLGVPGEDTGAGDEGGEMNMELEDEYDQDSERRGGGWDNAGGWSQGQERAWSSESGSDSHSNSPFVNRNGGSDWGSGGAGGAQQHRANSFSNWNKERGYKTGPTTAHPPAIPSLMQVSVPNNKGPESGAGQSMGAMAGFGAMSDAQKKKLPSWIRAGLEKMEKDKMKKEQDDERKRRFEERKRLEKLELAEEIKKDPSKSKFDKGSDNDNDTDDDSKGEPVDGAASQKAKQRKSRFEEPHQTEEKEDQALEDLYKEGKDEAEVTVEPTLKSKEEILAEMSSQLRALLTTLLLEVTDEEIHQISGDVIEKSLKSSKPQLQTLLSGYGSDSSASDNSDAEDSEEELKTSLSKKRSEFKALETDIRDYCAEETASYKQKEKKWLKGSTEESPLREGERSRSRSRSRSLAKSSKRNRSRSSESRRSGARNGTRNSSVDERRSISGDRKSSRRKRSRSSERSKKKSKKKGRSSSRSPSSPSRSQSRSRNKRKSRSKSEDSLKRRSQSRDSKVKKNKEKKKSKNKSRSRSRRRDSRSRSSSQHSKRKRSSSRNRRRSRSRSKGSKHSKRRSRSTNQRSRSRNKRSRSRTKKNRSRERRKSKKTSRSRSRSRKSRSKSRDRKKSKKMSRSRSKSPKSKKKSKRSNS